MSPGSAAPRQFPAARTSASCGKARLRNARNGWADAGVEVILGPAPRKGGRGFGKVPSLSLYARDPDDNLLEWMTYT